MELYEKISDLSKKIITVINESGLPLEISEAVLVGVLGDVRMSERDQTINRLRQAQQTKEGE